MQREYEPIELDESEIDSWVPICRARLSKDSGDYEALYGLAVAETDINAQEGMLGEVLRMNPDHLGAYERRARARSILGYSSEATRDGSSYFEGAIRDYGRALSLLPEGQPNRFKALVQEFHELTEEFLEAE